MNLLVFNSKDIKMFQKWGKCTRFLLQNIGKSRSTLLQKWGKIKE